MPPIGSPVVIVPIVAIQYILAPILDLGNYFGTLSTLWLIPLAITVATHYQVKLNALIAYCLMWVLWYMFI